MTNNSEPKVLSEGKKKNFNFLLKNYGQKLTILKAPHMEHNGLKVEMKQCCQVDLVTARTEFGFFSSKQSDSPRFRTPPIGKLNK